MASLLPVVPRCLPASDLLGTLRAKGRRTLSRQRHAASRALGLRSDDQQFATDPLERLPDGEHSFVQIQVRPAQAQKFAAPQR
ncbi:hypothetical protein [Streptomyces sp. NBC_00280]|uniref:hypothetical protein n=1 Tax=Streptomyces sp. NBC_00280 TaxID=2975699 RepID=UPI003255471F